MIIINGKEVPVINIIYCLCLLMYLVGVNIDSKKNIVLIEKLKNSCVLKEDK